MVSIKEFPFRFFIWNSADSGQRFGLKRWLKSKDLVFFWMGEKLNLKLGSASVPKSNPIQIFCFRPQVYLDYRTKNLKLKI